MSLDLGIDGMENLREEFHLWTSDPVSFLCRLFFDCSPVSNAAARRISAASN
jgi:hypothetical protein